MVTGIRGSQVIKPRSSLEFPASFTLASFIVPRIKLGEIEDQTSLTSVRLYEDDGLNEKEFKAFRVSFVEVPFSDIFIKHTSGTSRWVQYSK